MSGTSHDSAYPGEVGELPLSLGDDVAHRAQFHGGCSSIRSWCTMWASSWCCACPGRRFPFPRLPPGGTSHLRGDLQVSDLRFITFQFLHAGGWHLAVNLIGLYFFGPMVEAYWGRRRFLVFYLTCGVAGAVGYLLMWAWSNATPMQLIVNSYVPLMGASAGLFGILIAAARIAPDSSVLVYGFIPMKLKAMAWVMLAIAVWTVFTSGHNAGGEAGTLAAL